MSEENKNKELLLNLLSNRFQFLSDADNAVEAKANAILGFSVAIGLAFWVEKFSKISDVHKQVEARLGLVALMISVLIVIFCIIKSRTYGVGVVERDEIANRLKLPEGKFLSEALIDLQQSIDLNSKILKDKTRAFKFSMGFFIIGICLLALSSFTTIWL